MNCCCPCHDTPGHRINRRAFLGAKVTELRCRLPELEKTARKTPPRTLIAERARVEAAKRALPKLREALLEYETELASLQPSVAKGEG